MVTLITVGNSEGDRRCAAGCYEATGANCTCCCGGVNHGVGKAQAVQNTKDIANKVIKSTLEVGAEILPIQEELKGVFD